MRVAPPHQANSDTAMRVTLFPGHGPIVVLIVFDLMIKMIIIMITTTTEIGILYSTK